jgi:hypothetical protein
MFTHSSATIRHYWTFVYSDDAARPPMCLNGNESETVAYAVMERAVPRRGTTYSEVKRQPELLRPLQLQLDPIGIHTFNVHVRPQFGDIELKLTKAAIDELELAFGLRG